MSFCDSNIHLQKARAGVLLCICVDFCQNVIFSDIIYIGKKSLIIVPMYIVQVSLVYMPKAGLNKI